MGTWASCLRFAVGSHVFVVELEASEELEAEEIGGDGDGWVAVVVAVVVVVVVVAICVIWGLSMLIWVGSLMAAESRLMGTFLAAEMGE